MKKLTLSLTTIALAATLGLASIAPASADQAAATRNTILGAAALIAGIAIESNVANKNARKRTSVQGYTPNGATVYTITTATSPRAEQAASYYPRQRRAEPGVQQRRPCYVYGGQEPLAPLTR